MATKIYDSDADWAIGTEIHTEHSDGKLTLVSGQNEGTWIVDFDSELDGCGWGNFWWEGRIKRAPHFKNGNGLLWHNSDVDWYSIIE